MNIILLGAQGSGKGTQAQLLKEKYDLKHISTGDLIRKSIAEKDPDALKLKEFQEKGLLAPNELIAKIVEKNLGEGNIFDGFPRTLEQAEALDEMAVIDAVIELKLADDDAVKRLSGRRQCRKCAAVYGTEKPPKKANVCDSCAGELYQRDDDKPETIRKRLALYHEETEPLIEYYKPRNIVHSVDAGKSIKEIFASVCRIIEAL
ncbi:Adenylate kinase [uncultured archaeon]|nr:Adenylate kinase [uncultured archaeon]